MSRAILVASLIALSLLPAVLAEGGPTCVPGTDYTSLADVLTVASSTNGCADASGATTLTSADCARAQAAGEAGATVCVVGGEGPVDLDSYHRDCFRDSSGELWCCQYNSDGIRYCWEVISDVFTPAAS